MECREQGSHALGVYPKQDTSRMGTARGSSRHQNNSKRVVRNMEGRNVGTKGKKEPNKTKLALRTIEPMECRDSTYHGLD